MIRAIIISILGIVSTSVFADTELRLIAGNASPDEPAANPEIPRVSDGRILMLDGRTNLAKGFIHFGIRRDSNDFSLRESNTFSSDFNPPVEVRREYDGEDSRETIFLGAGSTWELHPEISLDAEIGGVSFSVISDSDANRTYYIDPVSGDAMTGTYTDPNTNATLFTGQFSTSTIEEDMTSLFVGVTLRGDVGDWRWRVDGMHFTKTLKTTGAARTLQVAGPGMDMTESSTWYSGSIAYVLNENWSLGLRAESAEPYDTLAMQLGWVF